MMELLNLVVKMNAREARQAREIIDAHIRDLDAGAITHLPHSGVPGHEGSRDECPVCEQGAELQRGLEVAVVRERERIEDFVVGAEEQAEAEEKAMHREAEEQGHVGYTDDF